MCKGQEVKVEITVLDACGCCKNSKNVIVTIPECDDIFSLTALVRALDKSGEKIYTGKNTDVRLNDDFGTDEFETTLWFVTIDYTED